MAFHNTNYHLRNLSGSEDLVAKGFIEPSGSPIHQVFCTSDGTINLTAVGGGSADFNLTAGQSVNILVGKYSVNSGSFVGFRAKDDRARYDYDPNKSIFAS